MMVLSIRSLAGRLPLWTAIILLGIGSSKAASASASDLESPLAPPDTSSPRATLSSFIERMDEIFRLGKESTNAYERRQVLRPKALFMLNCFDAHELAPSIAQSKCFQAAIYLKEILDRIDLPPLDQIPDADEARQDQIERYRIPGTEITLVKIDAGPLKGEFQFSTDTINRAGEFFERVRHMPYKQNATSKGLYDFYLSAQGWLIQTAWLDLLPGWMKTPIYEHAIWQWIALALFSLGGLIVIAASYPLGRRRKSQRVGLRGSLLQFAFPIVWIGVALLLDMVFSSQIRMTGQVLIALKIIFRFQLLLAGIVMVLTALNRVADVVIHTQQLRPEAIDSQLIRLGFRVLTFFVVAWLIVMGADYMGIAVTPLIAGLGVSGLAVALAAQHTIENLIAGIVLFADKPVRVGDFCRFGDSMGTVEQIGLRSTRVRALDRSLIAIPNADFAKLHLVNLTRRDQILLKTTLGLVYETTADQLRFVLVRLREMLSAHPRISNADARVRFVGYGEFSLDVEIFAFVKTSDWSEFLSIQEGLLLQIMDLINEAGTGFAFPTQTEYQASEAGINPARARIAEEKVKDWRANNLLASVGFAPDPSPKELHQPADEPHDKRQPHFSKTPGIWPFQPGPNGESRGRSSGSAA